VKIDGKEKGGRIHDKGPDSLGFGGGVRGGWGTAWCEAQKTLRVLREETSLWEEETKGYFGAHMTGAVVVTTKKKNEVSKGEVSITARQWVKLILWKRKLVGERGRGARWGMGQWGTE